MLADNVKRILHPSVRGGMDILIVTTHSKQQQQFWQRHLSSFQGELFSTLIVVEEDWKGGAGSGLGTLYAYQKASLQSGIDLLQKQREGGTIALYHTAGLGTRLAPLTLSEHNNKSAVKVGSGIPMLEAVIRQSTLFANTHRGRLLVFWGDQLFIPSVTPVPPTHAIEVFMQKRNSFDKATWKRENRGDYGIISGSDHLNKLDYETFLQLANQEDFGVSVGSFSLSIEMTEVLLQTFAEDLVAKSSKKDVEGHFWMPLTLDFKTYRQLVPTATYFDYDRVQSIKETFSETLYKGYDIGSRAIWWDFGNVRAFYENHLKLIGSTEEGALLRQFFGITEKQFRNNSLLIDVEADELDVESCVIIGGKFTTLRAKGALLYNVRETSPLTLEPETIRSDIFLPPDQQIKLYTNFGRCGKDDWSTRLPRNPLSYADLSTLLAPVFG